MNHLIHQAYEGEIYGIAFFSYFENVDDNDEQNKLWKALVEVETVTAELLLQHLLKQPQKYVFKTAELTAQGDDDAKKWSDLPWLELMQTLSQWVEPYEVKYRQWLQQCQLQDSQESRQLAPTFELIAEHETAIYHCLQAELTRAYAQAETQVATQVTTQVATQKSGLEYLSSFLNKYNK
ncbi:hypothetical protein ACFL6Z_11865 [Pseudomonadota bacterium]